MYTLIWLPDDSPASRAAVSMKKFFFLPTRQRDAALRQFDTGAFAR
jgi:hypothetical protein